MPPALIISTDMNVAQKEADEADDPITEDFLVQLMERHQKMAWMLRAHIQK
jgi:DNA-binding ferritin-like protein